MNNNSVKTKEYLRMGFNETFSYLRFTHKSIFEKEDYGLAIDYLSQAKSFVEVLKYINATQEDIYRLEFVEFIEQFEIYNNEVLESTFEDHSKQHSYLEYNRLVMKCRDVASSLDLSHRMFED